jgi:hypothetical protein
MENVKASDSQVDAGQPCATPSACGGLSTKNPPQPVKQPVPARACQPRPPTAEQITEIKEITDEFKRRPIIVSDDPAFTKRLIDRASEWASSAPPTYSDAEGWIKNWPAIDGQIQAIKKIADECRLHPDHKAPIDPAFTKWLLDWASDWLATSPPSFSYRYARIWLSHWEDGTK